MRILNVLFFSQITLKQYQAYHNIIIYKLLFIIIGKEANYTHDQNIYIDTCEVNSL